MHDAADVRAAGAAADWTVGQLRERAQRIVAPKDELMG